MSVPGTIAAFVVIVIVATFLFRLFFDGKRDFLECVKYGLKPDFFSWLDNDLQRDYGKSMKLGFYVVCCAAAGYAAYLVVESLG